jgi:hypothetical protein
MGSGNLLYKIYAWYFATLRRLTERQIRWADVMSRYNFTHEYRPGKLAARPDALSRGELGKETNDYGSARNAYLILRFLKEM